MFKNLFPAISAQTQNRPYTRPVLIAILVLAAFIRFLYLAQVQENPMPFMVSQDKVFDQYNYITMARDLVSHNWLGSMHPGHSPVYSYLIALLFSIFGADINVVFVFQIFYGILAVYLFYRCSVLLFENKNLGLLTAFVAALYGPLICFECDLLREAVIGYTNLSAFYFLLLALKKGKFKNYILGGLTLGLSLILRAGILPLCVLIYIFFKEENRRKRFKPFWGVLLGLALVIAPLALRNYATGFKALTETSGPTLFWLGNTYDSPGIGLTYTDTQKQLTDETQGRIIPTIKVLWREVLKHPAEYKSLWGRKIKMLFNGFEIPSNTSYDLYKEQSPVLKFAIFDFVLISPMALLALFLFYREYPRAGLLYVFIAALSVFVLVFHIQGRYRIAFVPFYILAGSYAMFWIYEIFAKKIYAALPLAAVLGVFFFFFTFADHDIMDRYFDGGIRSVDYSNTASAYLMQAVQKKLNGHEKSLALEQALKYYNKALPFLPDPMKVGVYITEAMIYRDLFQRAHAIDALAKALELDPGNPVAIKEYRNLTAGGF